MRFPVLIEPGPIAPIDVQQFFLRLTPEPPLVVDDAIALGFTAAADQLDAKAAALRQLEPPDDLDDVDDPELVAIVPESQEQAADALQPFNASIFEEVQFHSEAFDRYNAGVNDASIIAPQSAAPEGQAYLDIVDEPIDSGGGDGGGGGLEGDGGGGDGGGLLN